MAPLQDSGISEQANGKLVNSNYANDNQRFLMADNMDNMERIKRMWRAQWPEFSWLTVPGDGQSRCYQMFAPDISRVGYGNPDSNGNSLVWAIMCPQQGIWISGIEATLNIEVTVTQSGGQVNEGKKHIDAQMTIQPKIWFSPDTMQSNHLIKLLWKLFEWLNLPFPFLKANAIKLNAYGVDKNDQPAKSNVLNIESGLDPNYIVPEFAMHNQPDQYNHCAWSNAYVAVEIDEIISSGSDIADWFNRLIMEIFNISSGKLLQYQNVLSWNVWVNAPEEVFTPEWKSHAEYWRFSLDVNHRSPEGNGTDPKYYDGHAFNPETAAICDKVQELKDWLTSMKLISNFPLVKEIEDELTSILSKNCGRQVTFL